MKKVFFALISLIGAFSLLADVEVVGDVTWNYSVSSGKATVYKGGQLSAIPNTTIGKITIPTSLGGCPVTCIGSFAFSGCSGLTSVTISEGVTSIESFAFYDCWGLELVVIPKSVTSIGKNAFCGCSKMTSVTIPEGVVSIGEDVFLNCMGLTQIMVDVGNVAYKAENNCLVAIAGKTLIAVPFGCKTVDLPVDITAIPDSIFKADANLQKVNIPMSVMSIGKYAFYNCSGLMSVTIPSGVTSIGDHAFFGCSGLTSVTIPSSVTRIGSLAFRSCSRIKNVEFQGVPPSGDYSDLLSYGTVSYPRECGAEWQQIINLAKFSGYARKDKSNVAIVSAVIRENDPTVMDVVYKVTSTRPTVKLRALAFQDGERSFAKVVRPTAFIEGTEANVGDEITANVEHKLSWRISADWKIDLAKVKFEVLASDGDLLPLELTTIPKVGEHAAMEISWNAVSEQQVFDALLWMYADGDEGLTLKDGVLKNGTTQLSNGTNLSTVNAIGYVYGKMGFSVLSGDELKYANEMTRLGLSPSGVRQYAWREVND